jgi:hypothetical protein
MPETEIYDHFKAYITEITTKCNEGSLGYNDVMKAIKIVIEQAETVAALKEQALIANPPESEYVLKIWGEWVGGGYEPYMMMDAYKIVIAQGAALPPAPGSWNPPTTKGLHLILDNPGSKQFYMAGTRIADGLLLGTYRAPGGGARIQHYDGRILQDELNTPAESFYSFHAVDNGIIATCECDFAKIYKRRGDKWIQKSASNVQNALTFEPHEVNGALVALRVREAGANSGWLIRSTDNGETWHEWKSFSNKNILNMNSDGKVLRLFGNENDNPAVFDENFTKVAGRSDYPDNTYASGCGFEGKWNFGANSIKAIREERRGYIDFLDGANLRSVRDLMPPWVMVMNVYDGIRYAVCSVWNETDHQSAILVKSKDGIKWDDVCQIPCPSIISMSYADGGIYLFGGKFGEYGRVYFYKL